MSTILGLLVVMFALVLPFLDKIIYQNKTLPKAATDFHQVLDDGDCLKIPKKN